MNGMTPRERVLAAIDHREPDHVPIDFGGILSGISRFAYRRLLGYLGRADLAISVSDRVQQLAEPHEEILKRFGSDFRHIQVGSLYKLRSPLLAISCWSHHCNRKEIDNVQMADPAPGRTSR